MHEEISIFSERIVYATFWQRVGACLLDWLIIGTAGSILLSIFGIPGLYMDMVAGRGITVAGITSGSFNFLIHLLYFALMESGRSQATIGKMAVGLQVTDMNGDRISFGKAVGRYFGKVISGIILCIGYLMVAWDSRKQALHDKIAGTLVVKKTAV